MTEQHIIKLSGLGQNINEDDIKSSLSSHSPIKIQRLNDQAFVLLQEKSSPKMHLHKQEFSEDIPELSNAKQEPMKEPTVSFIIPEKQQKDQHFQILIDEAQSKRQTQQAQQNRRLYRQSAQKTEQQPIFLFQEEQQSKRQQQKQLEQKQRNNQQEQNRRELQRQLKYQRQMQLRIAIQQQQQRRKEQQRRQLQQEKRINAQNTNENTQGFDASSYTANSNFISQNFILLVIGIWAYYLLAL